MPVSGGEEFVHGPVTLRLGRWQDRLDTCFPHAVITDPPYGERTKRGHNSRKRRRDERNRQNIEYAPLDDADVLGFVSSFGPRTSGWMVAFASHDQIPAYEEAYSAAGRYAFSPVPWINRIPRLSGDGPSSWACYIMVARRRTIEAMRWGCLPGAYLPGKRAVRLPGLVGIKPTWLMRELVKDYSKPGDVICDPFAGSGSTLIAAALEGRTAVGAEMDEKTYALACDRIKKEVPL